LLRFYTGVPCARGHLAERYVANLVCTVCSTLASEGRYAAVKPRVRPAAKFAKPRHTIEWDWNHLTEAQKDLFFLRVDTIIQRKQKRYRHHSLEEPAVLIRRR
jgi:hypothetical protein